MNRLMKHRVNRRVVLALGLLIVGIATNAWHKNPLSGAVIVLTVIALAVWYGDTLSKGGPEGGSGGTP